MLLYRKIIITIIILTGLKADIWRNNEYRNLYLPEESSTDPAILLCVCV